MAKRLKVLITTDYYYPLENGVGTYVNTLTTFFPECDITILTYNLQQRASLEHKKNVTVLRVPVKKLFGIYPIAKQLPDIPAHDIVITNTRFFSTAFIGTLLAKRWHAKHIHVEHGNQHIPHANILVRLLAWCYDQTAGRFVLRSANKVVCISKKGLIFTKSLGARNSLWIPNAINPADFNVTPALRSKARKHFHLPKHSRVIVFVGRLVQEKGVQDLIEAMRGSADTLLIVGDGSYRKTLEELAQKQSVNAQFIGNQDAAGVRQALAAANLFVNPSWAEGLPTSVLEALAAGIPVIATNVGGTPELLPKDHLVEPRDISGLRKKLARPVRKTLFPNQYTITTIRSSWKKLLSVLI